MSDTESFDFRSTTVAELADQVQGCVSGDGSVQIRGAACIEEAESGDIVFAESPRFLFKATRSKASAVVAFLDAVAPDKPLIKVDNPRFAFARILELFSPMIAPPIGVHPSAVVGDGAEISATASVGANVVIGDRATIGDRSVVMGGCVLGDDVSVGEDCLLHANVSLYAGTRLGDRVILHSGVVVGSDGFGYVRMGARSHKVPHVGIVEIGDDVEVGANTTIDRAKTGSTIIGARTKIDNLVQIAHNVKMGEDCVVAALVGIAGSSVIGNAVTIAGQAGVRDHVSIGDGALVLGRAGVWGDTPSGVVVSGNPARSHRERLKIQAAESDLPRMARRLKELEAMNTRLEERTKRLESALDDLLGRPSG